jgi:hypothetical protein
MAFWGDQFTQDRTYVLGLFNSADMTAIVRLYMSDPEGFIVAADGLKTHSENPDFNILNSQKIFRIDGMGKQLAYSSTGTIQLTPDNSEQVVFDFSVEAMAAARKLYYRRYKDLRRYAIAFSELINLHLARIKSDKMIEKYPSSRLPTDSDAASIITESFVDGFYDGQPSRVAIQFRHDNQQLLEPKITDESSAPGSLIVQGPTIPSLGVLVSSPRRSLSEVVQAAKRYIESCSEPESIAIAPKECALIGGHVHAATITRREGFQWAIPPIGEQS